MNIKVGLVFGTAFQEAAASVNRKCSFWFGFFFSFASIGFMGRPGVYGGLWDVLARTLQNPQ
jgi:hypothetical protein